MSNIRKIGSGEPLQPRETGPDGNVRREEGDSPFDKVLAGKMTSKTPEGGMDHKDHRKEGREKAWKRLQKRLEDLDKKAKKGEPKRLDELINLLNQVSAQSGTDENPSEDGLIEFINNFGRVTETTSTANALWELLVRSQLDPESGDYLQEVGKVVELLVPIQEGGDTKKQEAVKLLADILKRYYLKVKSKMRL